MTIYEQQKCYASSYNSKTDDTFDFVPIPFFGGGKWDHHLLKPQEQIWSREWEANDCRNAV